ASGLTPLEYMVAVLRDPNLEPHVRLEAATKAAPYVHPRLSNVAMTTRSESKGGKSGLGFQGMCERLPGDDRLLANSLTTVRHLEILIVFHTAQKCSNSLAGSVASAIAPVIPGRPA